MFLHGTMWPPWKSSEASGTRARPEKSASGATSTATRRNCSSSSYSLMYTRMCTYACQGRARACMYIRFASRVSQRMDSLHPFIGRRRARRSARQQCAPRLCNVGVYTRARALQFHGDFALARKHRVIPSVDFALFRERERERG